MSEEDEDEDDGLLLALPIIHMSFFHRFLSLSLSLSLRFALRFSRCALFALRNSLASVSEYVSASGVSVYMRGRWILYSSPSLSSSSFRRTNGQQAKTYRGGNVAGAVVNGIIVKMLSVALMMMIMMIHIQK